MPEKVAIITCGNITAAICLSTEFRLRKIPINVWWGKSISSQINFAKKSGYNNLIYVTDNEKEFYYQDICEYPEWLCEENDTVNFEKRKYTNVDACITEELLNPIIMLRKG